MYIADLHVHSRYSRATSRDCTPEFLDLWARRKGICLIGTGDFTHPAWRQELCEKLRPAEEGLYVLKEEYRMEDGLFDDSILIINILTCIKSDGRIKRQKTAAANAVFRQIMFGTLLPFSKKSYLCSGLQCRPFRLIFI